MSSVGFENLQVYQLAEQVSDAVWAFVINWDEFSRNTIGRQMVRAADSIGANIAEGTGRGTFKDNRHYARIARGSLYETRHFLRRAFRRKLLSELEVERLKPIIEELGPRSNAYIKSIGRLDTSDK